MAEILIGTSGYSYPDWVGPVYPDGTDADHCLALYAGLFPTVELDFSYCGIPEAENLTKHLVNGGLSFGVSIKASQTLTRNVNPARWEEEAKTCLAAVEPLQRAGLLEALLFQFPYSFHYISGNRRYLDKLLTFFRNVPAAVEFRSADWYTGRVIEEMKSRKVPLVCLDLPELPKLAPQMDVVTAPLAYIRLHGRNKEAWRGPSDHARYDYLYTDSEIEAWAARIECIAGEAERILVYFNNYPFGKAVLNAQALEKILKKKGLMGNQE